jgi:hypothetical protein
LLAIKCPRVVPIADAVEHKREDGDRETHGEADNEIRQAKER